MYVLWARCDHPRTTCTLFCDWIREQEKLRTQLILGSNFKRPQQAAATSPLKVCLVTPSPGTSCEYNTLPPTPFFFFLKLDCLQRPTRLVGILILCTYIPLIMHVLSSWCVFFLFFCGRREGTPAQFAAPPSTASCSTSGHETKKHKRWRRRME